MVKADRVGAPRPEREIVPSVVIGFLLPSNPGFLRQIFKDCWSMEPECRHRC